MRKAHREPHHEPTHPQVASTKYPRVPPPTRPTTSIPMEPVPGPPVNYGVQAAIKPNYGVPK